MLSNRVVELLQSVKRTMDRLQQERDEAVHEVRILLAKIAGLENQLIEALEEEQQ